MPIAWDKLTSILTELDQAYGNMEFQMEYMYKYVIVSMVNINGEGIYTSKKRYRYDNDTHTFVEFHPSKMANYDKVEVIKDLYANYVSLSSIANLLDIRTPAVAVIIEKNDMKRPCNNKCLQ